MPGQESKVKFLFAVHSHQPVGNFDFVFREALDSCYVPFLESLRKHRRVKANLHYSGVLLEWMKKNRPEYLKMLRQMVKSGQLEMMTGGFYEPILPIIPDGDKLGQIQMLTGFIREEFGYDPVGLWLPERVWEPHLPKPLSSAGVKYLLVDDAHFKFSGLKEEQLHGYYLTEEEGYTLALFPSSKKLRYLIPFRPVEEFIKFMRELSQAGGQPVITYGDDGEKFGVWPGTHKHCYKEAWLEEFSSALEENSGLIETVHASEVIRSQPPLGRVYLPTASYSEMMQWALPSESYIKFEDFEKRLKEEELFEPYHIFVRGGFWRNFLAKYPESNNMHKKMLWVGEKINRIQKEQLSSEEEELLIEIKREKYRGQCNCAYWHGVFGGLYLPHLRGAIYKHLINAERLTDRLRREKNGWVDVHRFDFDRDGKEELIVETAKLNLYLRPDKGGSLFELDYKPKSINLLDTLTRREEGYHRQLSESAPGGNPETAESIHDRLEVKESGLKQLLFYDWYDRRSLIDHFLGKETTLESFSRCQYEEKGDFVNQP
ncbi:MAG: alpha-amylase/4-alpha-glucanotransferase domain-containing protein, partial [Candidatus Zixiibacteriota bacterium]